MVGPLKETGGTTDLMFTRDYRAPKEPLVRYVKSHNDDVTEVQWSVRRRPGEQF